MDSSEKKFSGRARIYIGNFAEFHVVSDERAALLRGTVGPAQVKLRKQKGELGIPLPESKALLGESEFVFLGASFERKAFGMPRVKRQLIALAWLWALAAI